MKKTIEKELVGAAIRYLVKQLFIVNGIYLAVLFLSLTIFRDLTRDIFHRFGDFVSVFFLIFFLVIANLWAFYRTLKYEISFITPIISSIDLVFSKKEETIELPNVLKTVESKLNAISKNMIISERNAKEAEQRKNDLVVYLAHDLKTPLTSVIGYLTLLEESPNLPVEQRAKYTQITLDKAYRLEELINEFFEITRFNLQNIELNRAKTNISMMIYQLVEEFHPMLDSNGLNIALKVQPDITAMCDSDKLARAFDNLLRNAVAYSYPNTTIEVYLFLNNDMFTAQFTNRGDEISPDKLSRIFEKFFRADNSRTSRTGGAGLGLAITKQIVELHGGNINAISNSQRTVFTVNIPLNQNVRNS